MSKSHSENKMWAYLASIADKMILFSYDRIGHFIHQHNFDPGDLDHSMQGKICVITGGNSGIGRATAKALAERGAEVFILCRDRDRGLEAVDYLREQSKNHHVHLAVVDIADLNSVRKFVEHFSPTRVDVLVHNAGVMARQKTFTEQGLELTFATSVAGPFLLTLGLFQRLRRSEDARVIFVSSGGAYTQKLKLDRLIGEHEPYNDLIAYAQNKRAQLILTEMFAQKMKDTSITFCAMHPGWADTPGVRSAMPKFYWSMRPLLRTPEQGADTAVWLAVNPEVSRHSGKLWFDRQERSMHLSKRTKETRQAREQLWQKCEELVDLYWPEMMATLHGLTA